MCDHARAHVDVECDNVRVPEENAKDSVANVQLVRRCATRGIRRCAVAKVQCLGCLGADERDVRLCGGLELFSAGAG